MLRRAAPYAITAVVAAAVAWYFTVGRQREGPSIYLRGAWVVVENQTKMEWTDVKVTVNAYYRGAAPRVAAGGRLEAPLSGFITGLGQRFNPARERVWSVEVRATAAGGQPIAIDWNERDDRNLAEKLREK